MSKGKVWIVAYTYHEYTYIAQRLTEAGYEVGTTWSEEDRRRYNPARLSTQQMIALADENVAGLESSDVLVAIGAAAFWAGRASALGIPAIVVGAYTDIGLYATGLHYADHDSQDVFRAVDRAFKIREQNRKLIPENQKVAGILSRPLIEAIARGLDISIESVYGALGPTLKGDTDVPNSDGDGDPTRDTTGGGDRGGELRGEGEGI